MINKMIRKNLIAEIKEIKSAIKVFYCNCPRQYNYATGKFTEYEEKIGTLNKTFNEF